jgi:hypothetical protein
MRRLSKAQNAEMQRLRLCRGRIVKAEDVVAFASQEDTALHSFFEWDDSLAAQQFRLAQARQVLALSVEVVVTDHAPVRAFVSLSSDRTNGGGYRRVRDAMNDEALRALLLEDALAELRLHRDKYEGLRELAKVWVAAEEVEKQTARKTRRKAA